MLKQKIECVLGTATETEINNYGYQLVNQGKLDEAITMFDFFKIPQSWNTYDSLAEAMANNDDKKKVKELYEKAYDMVPAGQKPRIEGILKGLDK